MAVNLLTQLGLTAGQRVFITPFTPMSEKLYRDLQEYNIDMLGFIDSNKKAENIIHPSCLAQYFFDKIIIISPNHGTAIYQGLLNNGANKAALTLVMPAPHYQKVSYVGLRIKQFRKKIKPASLAWLQYLFKGRLQDKETVLLLAKDFVDLNIKDLYIGLCSSTTLKPVIATDNPRQKQLLQNAGFNVVEIYSWRFIWLCLKASVKVLDHSPVIIELVHALKYSRLVQIWHGIPLKKIGHLINYKMVQYDLVVSTSPFVTDYAFAGLFSTKGFIESGYPRNDILQHGVTDPRQLVLVNHPIYEWVQQQNKPVVVYMPTWRGDSFNTNPIDLDGLASFASENDIIIVIKMHPFIRPDSFFDTLESGKYQYAPGYQHNIVFYPSTDDIYPMLNTSALLITDYSSVYFDYLLVNKPIIFFVYDLAQYIARHGDFMLSFEQHTPGDKARDYAELTQGILHNLTQDNWQLPRQQLRELLFKPSTVLATAQLCQAIEGFIMAETPEPKKVLSE